MITDMTEGKSSRVLIAFTLPMLLSVAFQQLYTMADSVIAGRYINMDALAAVGASFPITMIFMAIAMGCNIGSSVVISQLFGAKSFCDMRTAISTSLYSILGLSAILTAIGLLLCNPLIAFLNTPANIFDSSSLYLRIYIFGLTFLFLYNICTGIFTALGDSRTPLIFLICSSLGNIILDLVFVLCFHMGIAGVAWATFIAQGLSSVLALFALQRRLRQLNDDMSTSYQRFSLSMLGKIARISIPSILQQSFISVGNLFIQFLVNGYGSAVVAGYAGAMRLNTFAVTSFTALGSGLSGFTAQNIGAGKLDRVKKGFHAGLMMVICAVLPFTLLFAFAPNFVLSFFLKATEVEAIAAGSAFLRIVSPFYLSVAIKLIADGVLRGAGAMKPFMICTFTDLILRVILAFILSPAMGFIGIWSSWPLGWVIGMIMSYLFYARGKWKHDIPLSSSF